MSHSAIRAYASYNRLPGHALRSEGKAYGRNGEPEGPLVCYRGHIGQALCECGATSEVLWSDAARRRWHAAHKDELRALDGAR